MTVNMLDIVVEPFITFPAEDFQGGKMMVASEVY